MKIFENYNSAVGKYGEPLVRQMLSAGIPDKYLLSACRFHCSLPKKSIDILKVQFRQWMTYVVPFVRGVDVNNLTYEQFDELIRKEQQKHICPNPIYDDGNITIGEFKNKKDAALCPLKPLYDNDYGFCVCSEMGFIKYSKQGYRILVIIDKSKALSNDNTKYMFALVKDGVIDLWNANNLPVGSTEKPFGNEAWQYIDNLPDKAQEVLLTFARQTKLTESKTNKNMKKNVIKLNENTLRQIVAESVKKVLKEYEDRSFNSGEFYGEALDAAVQTYLDSLNIEPRYFVTDTEKIGKAFGDKLFEIANQNGNEYRKKLDAARINSTDYHGEGYGGYPY